MWGVGVGVRGRCWGTPDRFIAQGSPAPACSQATAEARACCSQNLDDITGQIENPSTWL